MQDQPDTWYSQQDLDKEYFNGHKEGYSIGFWLGGLVMLVICVVVFVSGLYLLGA